ncbi:hypothetical protein KL919_002747 [Ogataea angusta]|nr:hypothetical protein KL919_002747 [Ogataea angusta]
MASLFQLDDETKRLLTLDDFLHGLTVHEFVEFLAAKLSSRTGYDGAQPLDQLDPKPYIRTFEACVKELSRLGEECLAKQTKYEKIAEVKQTEHFSNVLRLAPKASKLNSQFAQLDLKPEGEHRDADFPDQVLQRVLHEKTGPVRAGQDAARPARRGVEPAAQAVGKARQQRPAARQSHTRHDPGTLQQVRDRAAQRVPRDGQLEKLQTAPGAVEPAFPVQRRREHQAVLHQQTPGLQQLPVLRAQRRADVLEKHGRPGLFAVPARRPHAGDAARNRGDPHKDRVRHHPADLSRAHQGRAAGVCGPFLQGTDPQPRPAAAAGGFVVLEAVQPSCAAPAVQPGEPAHPETEKLPWRQGGGPGRRAGQVPRRVVPPARGQGRLFQPGEREPRGADRLVHGAFRGEKRESGQQTPAGEQDPALQRHQHVGAARLRPGRVSGRSAARKLDSKTALVQAVQEVHVHL